MTELKIKVKWKKENLKGLMIFDWTEKGSEMKVRKFERFKWYLTELKRKVKWKKENLKGLNDVILNWKGKWNERKKIWKFKWC